MTEPTDRELVERVMAAGDEHAFRTLYRRHTPALYQFALRTMGGDPSEAEDVVQETWIRGTEGWSDFRWEAGLASWLKAIALNVCRAAFRRRNAGWLEAPGVEPAAPDGNPETRIDLERALALLPPGYRTVLLLHDLEGFRHEDIARMLGTSAGTSKSQLFRARRALRALLAPPPRGRRCRVPTSKAVPSLPGTVAPGACWRQSPAASPPPRVGGPIRDLSPRRSNSRSSEL